MNCLMRSPRPMQTELFNVIKRNSVNSSVHLEVKQSQLLSSTCEYNKISRCAETLTAQCRRCQAPALELCQLLDKGCSPQELFLDRLRRETFTSRALH